MCIGDACLSSSVECSSQAQTVSSYQERTRSPWLVALSPDAVTRLAARSLTDNTNKTHLFNISYHSPL